MGLIFHWQLKGMKWDLPGVPEVENLPSNAGDACLIPGQGLNSPSWSGNQKLTCLGLQSPHTSMKDPACHN